MSVLYKFLLKRLKQALVSSTENMKSAKKNWTRSAALTLSTCPRHSSPVVLLCKRTEEGFFLFALWERAVVAAWRLYVLARRFQASRFSTKWQVCRTARWCLVRYRVQRSSGGATLQKLSRFHIWRPNFEAGCVDFARGHRVFVIAPTTHWVT